eukprot:1137487-Pelagomonas_calceolata.AAC.5
MPQLAFLFSFGDGNFVELAFLFSFFLNQCARKSGKATRIFFVSSYLLDYCARRLGMETLISRPTLKSPGALSRLAIALPPRPHYWCSSRTTRLIKLRRCWTSYCPATEAQDFCEKICHLSSYLPLAGTMKCLALPFLQYPCPMGLDTRGLTAPSSKHVSYSVIDVGRSFSAYIHFSVLLQLPQAENVQGVVLPLGHIECRGSAVSSHLS